MTEKDSQTNVVSLLPLTAGLWLGYLLALLLIDHLFYPHPVFSPPYYLINGLNALLVLGLSLWPWGRVRLGRTFLPLVIGLLSVVPVVMGQLTTIRLPAIPASSPEAIILRTMPLLLMALILTAWQYGWRYVILFSGGIALFTLGLHLYYFRPGGPSLLPPVTVLVIQTVSFLVVGYFISTLITRLKSQQDSLARANAQLTDYAATLEELTISRSRSRLARELHDTLAHTLSALSVQLETVKAYWGVDPAVAGKLLGQVAGQQAQPATLLTDKLTGREVDVLRMLARDITNAENAVRLHLSEGTVRNHISAIFAKLDVSDRTQAAVIAIQHGLGRD